MGDKETFVNELDRLIYPVIEWLDDNQCLIADPDSADGEDFLRYAMQEGDLLIETTFSPGDTASPTDGIHVFLNVEPGFRGHEVYHRTFGGTTKAMRPGTWVLNLLGIQQELRDQDEATKIGSALERALSRVPAFSPI